MFRLISTLLLLAGLGAAIYGGMRLTGNELKAEDVVTFEGTVEATESVIPEEVVVPPAPPPPAPVAEDERALEDIPTDELGELLNEIETAAGAPEPSFEIMSAPTVTAEPVAPTVEEVAETLKEVPVAYETPEAASMGKTFDVAFALDATGNTNALQGLPGAADTRVVEGSARVSDRVRAQLSGSAFEISLESPDVQRLSRDTQNVWRWRVRPVEAGDHPLIMELFVLEGDEARPVRTFNDRVIVKVSPLQRAIGLANTANPIVMVLGGIGSALGGLFGVFRFFRPGR